MVQIFLFISSILPLFLIELSSRIRSHPYVTELKKRTELCPLEFIDCVVHIVGTLDETGLVRIDAQLYFDQHLFPVHQVDEDVLGFCVKFVLYLHDSQYLGMVEVYSLYFIVQGDDLIFF